MIANGPKQCQERGRRHPADFGNQLYFVPKPFSSFAKVLGFPGGDHLLTNRLHLILQSAFTLFP